jgi:hypothetical protein
VQILTQRYEQSPSDLVEWMLREVYYLANTLGSAVDEKQITIPESLTIFESIEHQMMMRGERLDSTNTEQNTLVSEQIQIGINALMQTP